MLAPICLFTYNRLQETQLTLQALRKNNLAKESDLFIFSDGPKNEQDKIKVDSVRSFLRSVDAFKSIKIIEAPSNRGLAQSIINGATQILKDHDTIIVLEDDLVTTPNFLDFMNQALQYYENEERIQSVNGYSLFLKGNTNDIYFQRRTGSWGWATWKSRWNPEIFDKEKIKNIIAQNPSILIDFKKHCGSDISKMLIDSINNRNDSWYVRWTFDHFLKEHYAVFHASSFIENIGHSNNATHCTGINVYTSKQVEPSKTHFHFDKFQIPDQKIRKEFLYYFSKNYKIIARIHLLKTKNGRQALAREIINKIKK